MQSTLLTTIVHDIRPCGLPTAENISTMSETEKKELYEQQKVIIQKFRDLSHDHVCQLQEQLKIAFDENKNIPLTMDFSNDSFGIPKSCQHSQFATPKKPDQAEKPALIKPTKSTSNFISYHSNVLETKPNMKMNPKYGKRPYFRHY